MTLTLTSVATAMDAMDLLTSKDNIAGDDGVIKDLARHAVDGKPNASVYATDGYIRLMNAPLDAVLGVFQAFKAATKGGNNDTKIAMDTAMMYGTSHNNSVVGGRLILAAYNGDCELIAGVPTLKHYNTATSAINKWSPGAVEHTRKGDTGKLRKALPFGVGKWTYAPNHSRVYSVRGIDATLYCETHGNDRRDCADCLIGFMAIDGYEAHSEKANFAVSIGNPIGWLGDVWQGNTAYAPSVSSVSSVASPLAHIDALIASINGALEQQIAKLESVRDALGDSVVDGAIADAKAKAESEIDNANAARAEIGDAVDAIANADAQIAKLEAVRDVLGDDAIDAKIGEIRDSVTDAHAVLDKHGIGVDETDSNDNETDNETDVDDTLNNANDNDDNAVDDSEVDAEWESIDNELDGIEA